MRGANCSGFGSRAAPGTVAGNRPPWLTACLGSRRNRSDPLGVVLQDERMRMGKRRRLNAARDASLLLVQDALVHIRAMAYLRKDMFAAEGDARVDQIDYQERIRLIADVCENLPGYLRASSRGTPLEGLQYVWDQASELQKAWLRRTLTLHGIVISDIITARGDESPAD